MAETLSNSGIVTGQPVLAAQVSQSVQAFTGAVGYDITISGSLNLPANTQMNGTASEAIYATSAGSTTGPVALITVSEETAAETNYIVFSPSSSVGGSAQNLKNTDTVGAGGATGGLEYNANTGNLKGKSFESSVSAATTIGFVGTSSFANSAVVSQTNTLTNEASDTTCFIPFYTSNTGDLPTKTNAGLTFNSATALLTVTSASVGDLISTGNVDMVSASFDDLVVSGAGRVTGRFTVVGNTVFTAASNFSNTVTVAGQIDSNKVGTLTDAALKFQTVASPDTYTAIHFDGTLDDSRIEYGMDAADEFFTRVRMSDNLNTDHFDIMFTGSGAGNNSFPFSAYGNKLLLSQEALKSKVAVGVSPSGSLGTMFTVESSASAASRVMAVRKENAGDNVFEVEIDASGDGFVGILSGSNADDGIRLHSNADSYFSKDLGIGMTTPASKLVVRSSASAASRIMEIQNNSNQRLFSFENNAAGDGFFQIKEAGANAKVNLSSEDNDPMYLGVGTGTPNLGIGTSNPTGDIHLSKTGSINIKYESAETDGTVYTRYANDAIGWRLGVQSNDRFALYDATNAKTHLIAENNSLRALIGIGTANPLNSVVLDVAGPMRLSGSMVNRFQALAVSNNTWDGVGIITSTSGETANASSSVILLSDNGTGPNSASLNITNWFAEAQTGQVLEVALVADAVPINGINLQITTPTVSMNGVTRGDNATSFSSSIFNCPGKQRGSEVKIMKTNSTTMKLWGSALMVY